MKKLIAVGVIAVAGLSAGGSVFAGEVTGSGKGGPNKDGTPGAVVGIFEGEGANSICAFSGLADGGEGEPAGPGNTQNWGHIPKEQRGVGEAVPPGISCNGHTGFVAGGGEE